MRLERFERPTDGFEIRCSIQLSYKRFHKSSQSAKITIIFTRRQVEVPFFPKGTVRNLYSQEIRVPASGWVTLASGLGAL